MIDIRVGFFIKLIVCITSNILLFIGIKLDISGRLLWWGDFLFREVYFFFLLYLDDVLLKKFNYK